MAKSLAIKFCPAWGIWCPWKLAIALYTPCLAGNLPDGAHPHRPRGCPHQDNLVQPAADVFDGVYGADKVGGPLRRGGGGLHDDPEIPGLRPVLPPLLHQAVAEVGRHRVLDGPRRPHPGKDGQRLFDGLPPGRQGVPGVVPGDVHPPGQLVQHRPGEVIDVGVDEDAL